MSDVFCVFQVRFEDEHSLWKIFDSKEKAETWIKEHGQWAKFVVEKWNVR